MIRASLGGVFSVPVIFAANEDFHSWCLQTNVKTVAAALSAQSKNFYDASLQGGIAFILGTEAHGLSRFWLERANELVKIPMNGVCDSLNVSVAAAVCIYEAVRQRCV